MPSKRPIRLEVSNKTDFFLPVCLLQLLVVFAALLSSYPVLLALLAIVSFGAGWAVHISGLAKTNTVKLTLVIFADGRVQLESSGERISAGVLDGQQWCTHQLAVLRITDGETTRKLPVLSARQREAGDFRRLNMWLRHGLCDKAGATRLLSG
jgi:hypothetical protein